MVPEMQTWHAGWMISTACWDAYPLEWRPGDPPTYCATGKAELIQPNAYDGGWLSKEQIVSPANFDDLFTDSSVAHSTIVEALRGMIDELKVP